MRTERPQSRRARRRSTRERGQVIVEFALVLPLLMLVLLGILQFGLLFYNYIDLTSATRDAARTASVSRMNPNGVQAVKNSVAASTNVVKDANTTVTVTPGQPWSQGDTVSVKVTYPYKVNLLGLVVWNGPMHSESVARVE